MMSYEEALKVNGKEGYRPQDATAEREAALVALGKTVVRKWVVMESREALCETHGAYSSNREQLEPASPRVQPFWTKCPVCDAAVAQEQRQRDASSAEMRKTIERMRLTNSGIPERHIESDFWNYQHRLPAMDRVWRTLRGYAEELEEGIQFGRCAILWGPPGTGKSHLAVAILRTLLLKHGGTGVYVTQARFVARLKSAMEKHSAESEDDIYRSLVLPDLLVIDEIGRGNPTPWERSAMFRLLDERYSRKQKPTVVVTNLAPNNLGQEIDAAGLDRLRENGGVRCHFNWESQRT